MQTLLFTTLLILVLFCLLSIAINISVEMKDQVWEEYLSTSIFIICDNRDHCLQTDLFCILEGLVAMQI